MVTMATMRDTALGAARSIIREKGLPMTLKTAERVLDDYAREYPQSYAGAWWLKASDNQYKLFKREWRKWLDAERMYREINTMAGAINRSQRRR